GADDPGPVKCQRFLALQPAGTAERPCALPALSVSTRPPPVSGAGRHRLLQRVGSGAGNPCLALCLGGALGCGIRGSLGRTRWGAGRTSCRGPPGQAAPQQTKTPASPFRAPPYGATRRRIALEESNRLWLDRDAQNLDHFGPGNRISRSDVLSEQPGI